MVNDVVAVMDMDGFRIRGRFWCKELGYLVLAKNPVVWSNLFFSADVILSMGKQDWKQHDTIIRKGIYDIPITRRDTMAIRMEDLDVVVKTLYPGYGTVAYKGGIIERNLLRQLGIPSLDLEPLGCPKADVLAPMFPEARSCGLHRKGHCPRQEVTLFTKWMLHAMERRGMEAKYVVPQRLCSPLEALPQNVFVKPLFEKIKL